MKFTVEELSKIIQLIDYATRAGGIEVAKTALPLAEKIQRMANEMLAAPINGATEEK